MGMMVSREDPTTGLMREYYKGDDGLLYNDYNHAVAERSQDPAVTSLVTDVSEKVDTGILGTSESTGDYYNRQGIGERDSTLERIGGSMARGSFSGVDGVLENTITDPNALTASRLVRDVAVKALPGDQKYVPPMRKYVQGAEGNVKKIARLASQDPVEFGTHQVVARHADDALEAGSEYVGRQGARAALSHALKQGGKAYAKRMAGGAGLNAATGGLATPLLNAWAAYDLVDTAQGAITGAPIHRHYVNTLGGDGTDDYYSGKMRGDFGLRARR